ncbi:N-acetylneuraminate synthase [Lachnospiraceae bacterium 62-35]
MDKVYIIAEAGVNHNGSLDLAKQMVLEAKKTGADAVKFQTFAAENLVTKYAQKAQYQREITDASETQYQMLKKLELSYDDYYELKALCESVEIDFLSTPFDLASIELLERLGVTRYKIPSGEITNYPYLVLIAKTRKPVILSTGMCTLEEVEDALEVLKKHGTSDITLLHCNTQYPTPVEDVNLKAICTLKDRFHMAAGYSDHTLGIEISVAAAAIGAQMIEKHFTMDRTMKGPDHRASLEPREFTAMVKAIRNVEMAMGSGVKKPSVSETPNIVIARKSITALKKISKGEKFNEENITAKRPGNGISPMKWLEVIGKTACRDFEEDELIEL